MGTPKANGLFEQRLPSVLKQSIKCFFMVSSFDINILQLYFLCIFFANINLNFVSPMLTFSNSFILCFTSPNRDTEILQNYNGALTKGHRAFLNGPTHIWNLECILPRIPICNLRVCWARWYKFPWQSQGFFLSPQPWRARRKLHIHNTRQQMCFLSDTAHFNTTLLPLILAEVCFRGKVFLFQ